MSMSVAPASAPAGQATLPGVTTPPAADATKTQTTAETPSATRSMLAVETKTEGQATQPDAAKAAQSAPQGELTIKVPDGIEMDPAALESFKSFAKTNAVSSELASKFVAWNVEYTKQVEEAASKQSEAWFAQLESDADFGRANLKASQQSVRRAVAKFLDNDLLSELSDRGLDNHPGLIKALKRIGDTLKEDDSSTGSGSGNDAARRANDQESQLRTDYPSMFKEQGS